MEALGPPRPEALVATIVRRIGAKDSSRCVALWITDLMCNWLQDNVGLLAAIGLSLREGHGNVT